MPETAVQKSRRNPPLRRAFRRTVRYDVRMTTNENPTSTVTTMTNKIHQGRQSRRPGMVVTACNGRTQNGMTGASSTGSLCERCFNAR